MTSPDGGLSMKVRTGPSRPTTDSRLTRAAFATGSAATLAFLLLPSGSTAKQLAWTVPFTLAAVLLTARFRTSPREVRPPLGLLLAGALLYAGAAAVWYLGPFTFGAVLPFPSPLDAVFFASYACYALFLLLVLRRRARDSELESRLALADAAIVTLALSAALWVVVIDPSLDLGLSATTTGVAIGYPAVQLLLVALALRLAISNIFAHRGVSLLVFLWIGGELIGDISYGVQSAHGTFHYDDPTVMAWMLSYTGLAAFAAHPGAVDFLRPAAPAGTAPGADRLPRALARRLRTALLLLAALVPLTLAAFTSEHTGTLLTVSGLIFALALGRASLLAGDLAEQRWLARELADALGRLRSQHAELTRLAAAVDAASEAIITCSPDGVVLHWNSGAERLYGFHRQEAVGQHVDTLLRPGPWHQPDAMAAAGQDGPDGVEHVVVRRDGSTVEVEATVSGIHDPQGRPAGAVGIARDVTRRNALQRELAAHAQWLDEAQRLAAVGSLQHDLVTGREVWSPELFRLLEVERTQEPSFELFLDRIHPQDRALVRQQNAVLTRERPIEFEVRVCRTDGGTRWVHVRAELAVSADGTSRQVSGSVHDVTDRKLASTELERLALTDGLTGLPNRSRFTQLLQTALEQVGEGQAVGLLLLDLDGFKDVNDGIGHHAGDLVLQEVARRISEVLRGGDEVARLGGDEFAVVLPEIGDVENAVKVAVAVRSCLEPEFDLDGITTQVGGSIGIAVTDEPISVSTLLKRSDVAMYRAKALTAGWAVFSPDQDDVAAGRLQLVNDLRTAIERAELRVAYQPILDTRTRKVNGFEALARWQHPTRGVIPPDQFVPLAEQADLIVPLTRLVLRQAVRACAAWRRAGHDLRVGVNLSVRGLQAEDPCAMVAEALAEADLEPQHLVLEITETSLATEGEQVVGTLHALRELGVTLVIDDFGTGYSAMSYLKQLPVEELKIDRSFIRDIATDPRDLAIVRSLVRLAHSLSLRVVAEGVETLSALEVLTSLGCDFVQGYGIARPMPAAETADWLDRYAAAGTPTVRSEPVDLLVVDDSAAVRAQLTAFAERAGWRVRAAASAELALVEVERAIPDVVVLDHYMTGMTGMDAVPELRARGFDGPILLFTQFLSDALPSMRVPLDVWPVSKSNPRTVLELLEGYRTSARGSG